MLVAIAALALQVPPEGTSLQVRVDPINDRASAFAVITGDMGRLRIGCDPNEFTGVRVQLMSRFWLANESFISGTRSYLFRVDRRPAVRVRFETERRTAWINSRAQVARFISNARNARRVVIQAIDVEGREIDHIFPLAEARPVIDEMVAICSRQGARPQRV